MVCRGGNTTLVVRKAVWQSQLSRNQFADLHKAQLACRRGRRLVCWPGMLQLHERFLRAQRKDVEIWQIPMQLHNQGHAWNYPIRNWPSSQIHLSDAHSFLSGPETPGTTSLPTLVLNVWLSLKTAMMNWAILRAYLSRETF
jgi:hypothetical protein